MTNEFQLVEKRELREEFIGRMEVLDKVGDLILLPSTEFATTEQVATYYGVPKETIETVVIRNKEELESDGYETYGKSEIVDFLKGSLVRFKNFQGYMEIEHEGNLIKIANRGLRLFPKRAILRVGMLLRDSEVAKEVRAELLKENPDLYNELSRQNIIYFKKYETEMKNYLEFSFGKENVKCQVPCGRYKLDFVLFDIVHIEVDENGHLNYNELKEKIRADYIYKNTEYWTFRYNPHTQKPYELMFDILDLFNNMGLPKCLEKA